jgi:hypothetical protein
MLATTGHPEECNCSVVSVSFTRKISADLTHMKNVALILALLCALGIVALK